MFESLIKKLTGPLFFVEGDHSLESVKKELGEIIRHAPDARILLHDTFFQSKESGYNTGLPGMTLLYS